MRHLPETGTGMKKMIEKDECLREDCFLCKSILTEWLEVVRLKREVLRYKKNEVIFREGEAVKGVYFMLSGKVKVHTSWGDKEYILRLCSAGDIFGHRGLGLDATYPVSATALESTSVCFINTALFMTLLRTNNDFLFKLAFFFADELKRTERRMKNLAHMPVKGRVAEALLMIRDAFGLDENKALKYRMSRKDMASMAGTTYETVIRMLNELVAEGLITLDERNIRLLDESRLRECCQYQKG